MNIFFQATLLLVFPTLLQAAGVYKWVDEHGNIHYSDAPQNLPAEKIDISPEPDLETVEQARQRENILRQAADDLQTHRKQREIEQQKREREKKKQQRKEQQALIKEKEKKKKEQREGRSQGHYQKQWEQQLPPQHPATLPSKRQ